MRSKFFLIMVTIALLCKGGQGTYTALTNLTPKKYSVESYIQQRPPEKWLRLTDGELNMLDVSYMSFLGAGPTRDIYVPLRPIGYQDGEPDHILVQTRDPALFNVAVELNNAQSDAEIARLAALHGNPRLLHKEIQGLIREGMDLKASDAEKLRKANPNLAGDFIILEEGASPEPGGSIVFFAGGVLLAVWLAKSLFRRKIPLADGAPPPPPPSSPAGSRGRPPLPG